MMLCQTTVRLLNDARTVVTLVTTVSQHYVGDKSLKSSPNLMRDLNTRVDLLSAGLDQRRDLFYHKLQILISLEPMERMRSMS